MKKEQRYSIREENGKFAIWERTHEGNPARSVHNRVSVFDTEAEAKQEKKRLEAQT